ncbi:MAG: hypothetical protein ACLP5H_07695 [Desulfomonilaceae bacterium]
MRCGKVFVVVGLVSLALAVSFAGSSYGQPTVANTSYDQSSATEYADNVVSPEKPALQASVTTVHWTRWRYGSRAYWRGPYYRYGYYASRPYPRCWWNGWRWICRPKTIIIY